MPDFIAERINGSASGDVSPKTGNNTTTVTAGSTGGTFSVKATAGGIERTLYGNCNYNRRR
ncbi:hypothetical protein FACS189413_01380 [Bacteroidia bacterium]|nr:hypothetical protein FACS189413_01380 [Bacteroidia bacterium]